MAYQTSCASYTSGRVGLSSATAVVADAAGREQAQHGSPLFPIACYAEDLSCFSVAWHWHEEFEFILAALGPIHVDVNKTRLTLQTGQGVFINSGALHAVEPAEGRALLHSGVFQPCLLYTSNTYLRHNGLVLGLGHHLMAQIGVGHLGHVGITVQNTLRLVQQGLELVLVAECFLQVHSRSSFLSMRLFFQ